MNYDREAAIDYAREWALTYNPAFRVEKNSEEGANFISQCLYSGAGVMNSEKENGWYYKDRNRKSKSWTSHDLLFEFLVNNKSEGPFAEVVSRKQIVPGDVIQIGMQPGFSASLFVTDVCGEKIYICSHNNNVYMYSLSCLNYQRIRFLHILGVR